MGARTGQADVVSWFERGDIVPGAALQLVGSPQSMVYDSGSCWIDLRSTPGPVAYLDLAELWRERQVEQAVPGERLRSLEELEGDFRPHNAVLALGHTRGLYLKFRHRGRFYTSAINITGNLPAYVPLSPFYAQVFACCLRSTSYNANHLLLALRALGTFVHATHDSTTDPNPSTLRAFLTAADAPVWARQDSPGPMCHLALAGVLALPGLALQHECWVKLVMTVFERYCEALAGHKSQNTAPDTVTAARQIVRELLDTLQVPGLRELTPDVCAAKIPQHVQFVLRQLLRLTAVGVPPRV